jgi:hypothetical protein
MISIIVSSYRTDDFSRLEESIKTSIGVTYELVKIDNPNRFSLSEAYNYGAEKARFDLLLFVHEDVTFKSTGWGGTLVKLFAENPKLGVVGVAGALKKSMLPTGWGTGTSLFDRINLIQSTEGKAEHHTTRKGNETGEQVKVLDGVFLATPKKIWEEVKFDETLPGYHIYDIDFSLRITQNYVGLVSYEILLTHFSMGNYNSEWVELTLAYHKKRHKRHLFDPDISFASKSRRAWYKALTYGNILDPIRAKYLREMGYDWSSGVHALAFRFPILGKRLFGLLAVIGL